MLNMDSMTELHAKLHYVISQFLFQENWLREDSPSSPTALRVIHSFL